MINIQVSYMASAASITIEDGSTVQDMALSQKAKVIFGYDGSKAMNYTVNGIAVNADYELDSGDSVVIGTASDKKGVGDQEKQINTSYMASNAPLVFPHCFTCADIAESAKAKTVFGFDGSKAKTYTLNGVSVNGSTVPSHGDTLVIGTASDKKGN